MPELPEVEVTRRGIAPTLTGNRVFAVITRTPALRYPLPENLTRMLGGQCLVAVIRRGKYLLLDFGHGHLPGCRPNPNARPATRYPRGSARFFWDQTTDR